MGCTIHTIVGNHTAYYKNTNEVNAVDLLLREYDNVNIYSEATEIKIDKFEYSSCYLGLILRMKKDTLKLIKKTKCPMAMGHLEL